MAVTLLALSNGHFSLEFEPDDFPAVGEAILDKYGKPTITHYPACASYHFGGSSFTFQNEWDDPCLISGSSKGDEILTSLYAALKV